MIREKISLYAPVDLCIEDIKRKKVFYLIRFSVFAELITLLSYLVCKRKVLRIRQHGK